MHVTWRGRSFRTAWLVAVVWCLPPAAYGDETLGSAASADKAISRYVLSSASTSERHESFDISSDGFPEYAGAAWSVKKVTLHGGKQEGVELVTIDNGRLAITVVPTRGMSILDVRAGDLRLGWNSPVKEVVHPQFVDLESRGGLGWLDGFNEWLVRCGLEFAGHPGKDVFIDNTGATAEMDLTLHGKIGNIPASQVELLVEREPPHRLRLRGVVYERLFFGPNLELATELIVEPAANTFRIEDTVTNRGALDQEFQLIYHTNFGRPLLEAGSQLAVAAERVAPMNEHAAPGTSHFTTYEGPAAGFIEEVYLVHPYSRDERTEVLLHNAAGTRGATIAWSTDELPFLTVWKNTAAEATGYVTGLEPATCFPCNRSVERRAGRVPKLAPNESRRFALDFGVLVDRAAVDQAKRRVAAIQADRPTAIDPVPDVSHE